MNIGPYIYLFQLLGAVPLAQVLDAIIPRQVIEVGKVQQSAVELIVGPVCEALVDSQVQPFQPRKPLGKVAWQRSVAIPSLVPQLNNGDLGFNCLLPSSGHLQSKEKSDSQIVQWRMVWNLSKHLCLPQASGCLSLELHLNW